MCETLLEFTKSACWMQEEEAVICLLLLLWVVFVVVVVSCSLTHCSYHFALSNINIALASTNIGHVLCSYFNCTLCLEFPFFCFPGKLLLSLYNLDQVSTPSGNSS